MSRNPKSPRRPTIALCVIARDEERFMADCLDSARPFVDEMVVLDTGSVDRTREIAREHGARVETFVWCDDFAAARNAAIAAATAEWILMLDADERLAPESGPVLQGLPGRMPADIDGGCPLIESKSLTGEGGSTFANQVPRFFRRSPEIRFVGAIHEDLVHFPNTAARNVIIDDLHVIHFGYDQSVYAGRNKDQRNRDLLERQLARDPNDARALFFLAQQHHAMGRHEEAVTSYHRFLANRAGAPRAFTVEVHVMLLKSLAILGRYAEMEAVAREAEHERLLSAAAYEVLGECEERRKRFSIARDYLQRALGDGLPTGLTWESGSGGWSTRLQLARVYEHLGDQHRALEELERAYPDLTPQARAVVSPQATALAVRAGAADDAVWWLGRARSDVPNELTEHLKLIELALRVRLFTPAAPLDAVECAVFGQDFQAAYDLAVNLDGTSAADCARALVVSAELRQRGALEAALKLLERLLDAAPTEPQVYWELMRTLRDLGRYEDAQLAVQAIEGLTRQAA